MVFIFPFAVLRVVVENTGGDLWLVSQTLVKMWVSLKANLSRLRPYLECVLANEISTRVEPRFRPSLSRIDLSVRYESCAMDLPL